MKDKVLEQLKTQFRPEFLNRVDSFVVFRSLNVEEIRQIVDLLLARVRSSCASSRSTWTSPRRPRTTSSSSGYDVDYGARPLRRVIQTMVEDPLAEALLLGKYTAGQTDRRGSVAGRRPDHRAGRREDARRGALGAWRGPASRYVCQSCGAVSARAGKGDATRAAPGTRWSRRSLPAASRRTATASGVRAGRGPGRRGRCATWQPGRRRA